MTSVAATGARTAAGVAPHAPRSRLDTLASFCFAAVIIIGFADISGDYPTVFGQPFRFLFPQLRGYVSLATAALLAVLVLIGALNWATGRSTFRASVETKLFLGFLTVSTLWGMAVGLLNGVRPAFVLGDAQNVGVYLCVFALRRSQTPRQARALAVPFWIGVGILGAKFLLSTGSNLAVGEAIGGRYMFKLSTFFIVMLFHSLALSLTSPDAADRRKYLGLVFYAAFGVLIAQMRGFFLGIVVASPLFAATLTSHRRRLVIAFAAALCVGAFVLVTLPQSGPVPGWVQPFTTDSLSAGWSYRVEQFDFLMSAFRRHWIVGNGLGWFDPNSGFYPVWAARPYLVELEYPNLLVKLGVGGFAALACGFASLLFACAKSALQARSAELRGLMAGWTGGLVAMLIVSASNPVYSSLYFHLFVVVVLLTLSAVRWELRPARNDRDRSGFSRSDVVGTGATDPGRSRQVRHG